VSEMTLPPAALNSSQTFLGSPARVASLLLAGAAVVASLGGRTAPSAAPDSALPEALLARPTAVEIVVPVATPALPVVLVQSGPRVVLVMPPAAPSHDRADRDAWSSEPDGRRPASVARPAGPVKVVPETPSALRAPIARAAAKYSLPADVLSAALARESYNFSDKYVYGYHVDGTGRGVAGIDKKFHPEVSDQEAFDPNYSVDWMAQYLSAIVTKNGGDVYSALREYNGGPNFASQRAGYQGRTVSELTRTHADSIMAHAARAVAAA
jgi:hypothetical protein